MARKTIILELVCCNTYNICIYIVFLNYLRLDYLKKIKFIRILKIYYAAAIARNKINYILERKWKKL